MDNLDALPVVGHTLDHWLVYDIPASITALAENAAASLPFGAKHGTNAADGEGYLQPCPPSGSGANRYYFRLYALDTADLNPTHINKIGIEARGAVALGLDKLAAAPVPYLHRPGAAGALGISPSNSRYSTGCSSV